MKKTAQILSVVMLLFGIACKKEQNIPTPVTPDKVEMAASDLTITQQYPVTLIAGGSYFDGPSFLDGKGAAARFGSAPGGIFETEAGVLYFADTYNHAIRKITTDGNVTTLQLPTSLGLYLPNDVYRSKQGTLYIAYIKTDFQFYLGKVDAAGKASYATIPNNKTERFLDLEDDRANGSLLAATYPNFYKFADSSPEGTPIHLQSGYFATDDYDLRTSPTIEALATSQTGDRYFTSTYGKHIYLKDSLNNFKGVFKNFNYTNITSIAVSADGKEIYIADDGSIKKISATTNSIVTLVKKVVGNTPEAASGTGVKPMDSHVPLIAYANHLTISHDGNYLYFTSIADFSTTINKVKIH
ncbi:NHL repeat-containing protein [Mucilaginibacter agri]|uniref:NHL repeat-containing protein n=1 Tax=Mucilaginibacter agri TaxID=2695265 RepID=A0A966DRR3_9SPHI|nr:hypothetical protein [Mucilaginibacter agri]NCD69368.1 hypothetical protein [Mucilaginibacter agri]